MAVLRQHMLMVLPIVGGIADRVGVLEAAGALPRPVRDLLDRVAEWLAAGTTDPAAAERLRGEVQALDAGLGPRPDWNALVLASLLGRLRDFIDLSQDIRVLRAQLTAGLPPSGPLRSATPPSRAASATPITAWRCCRVSARWRRSCSPARSGSRPAGATARRRR